jgi:hypothetical protein
VSETHISPKELLTTAREPVVTLDVPHSGTVAASTAWGKERETRTGARDQREQCLPLGGVPTIFLPDTLRSTVTMNPRTAQIVNVPRSWLGGRVDRPPFRADAPR